MLVRIASRERLTKTFGPTGALFIMGWPYGTEIRYREKVVLFFDKTGQYMVGFPFDAIRAAAAFGTPKQFWDEVERWLERAKRGMTPPQRHGYRW